jgi:anti-sigma regulatory factor (Ser/Thr protein kinase)
MKTVTFHMAPEFAAVDEVREALKSLCDETFPGAAAASHTTDLCIAATEAMNNAVEHSGAARIGIEMIAREAGVVFRLITAGERFDPTANVAMPSLEDDNALPEGGFGLAIIREIVDVIRYDYVDGRNVLTLEKHFP